MPHEQRPPFETVDHIRQGFRTQGYVCSAQVATTLFLGHRLQKPILVEGPAGVGKTDLGKTTAEYLQRPLIRLQCYEGLDDSKALYEWKYGKQLLYTQILKEKLHDFLADAPSLPSAMDKLHRYDDIFFSPAFLEPRPLLRALQAEQGAVLLVDEVDKADPEFEAFLLEVLSDFQVSIPELGTIRAVHKPFVILTSNNTRELSEALKRRCLHLYIPFPDLRHEMQILRSRVPELEAGIREQIVRFIHQVRALNLKKPPSVSESIDWAKVLLLLHATQLDPDLIRETLNVVVKSEEDAKEVSGRLNDLLQKTGKAA